MTDGYTKLFGSIVDSTIWQEDLATKVVWITMLAMADRDGYVGASVPGLAARSGVTVGQCMAALEKFMAPDPHSRTKDNEGRRVAEADRGWFLLNHARFRDMKSAAERREQLRAAQQRQRVIKRHQASSSVIKPSSSASASATADTDQKLLETRAHELTPANHQTGERAEDIARIARTEFIRRYSAERTVVPSENALAKSMPAVIAWLRASAPLQGVSEQTLCGRLMEAFFASPKARESGFKVGFLAHDPSEWLEPPRAPPPAKPRLLSFDEQKREAGVSKLAAFDRETESFLGYAKTDKDRKTWADERAHARMLIERKLG